MSEVLATRTVILVETSVPPTGSADLSQYINTSDFPEIADTEDLTTYGKTSKVYRGTLKDATFTMGGVYDDGSTNTPRAMFKGRTGDLFQITRRTEGTGSGLPQEVFDAVLTNYTETNPVSGHVMWSSEFQCTDDIDYTDQS